MAIGIVETTYGLVQGVEFSGKYEGITSFRGIPYAAPPTGTLRWKPPVPPEPWTDVRICDTYGPAAVQTFLSDRHAREYYFSGLPAMSEDCLYLNLTTGASSSSERRPIYIWFHGGGLTNCFAYEEEFNPQELARKGVIVVTVGQRLSLFGYLALPQLTIEQDGRSGNYGFMDQLMALKWVYDNAPAFGGDPELITVGGQSGGSLKAGAMAATSVTHGMVKRVIAHSGNKMMLAFKKLADAQEQGRDYLRYIGLDPDISLSELRSLDTFRLYADAPRAVMPAEMIVDSELVPFSTLEEGLMRYAGAVDIMNGSNLGEADVFAASSAGLGHDPVGSYVRAITSPRDFRAHFRNLLGYLYDRYDCDHILVPDESDPYRSARLLAGYGLAGREGMNFSRNLMLNTLFGQKRRRYAHTGRTFTYFWTHIEPCRPEDYGTEMDPARLLAWHSSEMWYSFNSLREGVPPTRPWEDLDFEIGERMSSYWAHFIGTGDPNAEGLPFWPESGDTQGWMELGDEATARVFADTPLDSLIRDFVRLEYGYRWS